MTPEQLAEAGVRYDVSGAVATVTLSRPEVRNAQTPAMWRALAAIGDEVPDGVRVVVVRGEGRSFSSGLDRALLDWGMLDRGMPDRGMPDRVQGAGEPESVAGLLRQDDQEICRTVERFQRGFTWLRDPRFV